MLPEVESRTQGLRPRTQKNFKAKVKDRSAQGQGPRTQTQVFSKEKSLQHLFQAKKIFKNLFQAISTWGNQKKVFADFGQGFWRFPTKFQRFKNSAVLKPRTRQFSRTWGFEAKAKDFKMCPRGQEHPWGLHLWMLLSHFGKFDCNSTANWTFFIFPSLHAVSAHSQWVLAHSQWSRQQAKIFQPV